MTKRRQNITITNTAHSAALQELPPGRMSKCYELGLQFVLWLRGSEVFNTPTMANALLEYIGRDSLQDKLLELDTWIEVNG